MPSLRLIIDTVEKFDGGVPSGRGGVVAFNPDGEVKRGGRRVARGSGRRDSEAVSEGLERLARAGLKTAVKKEEAP